MDNRLQFRHHSDVFDTREVAIEYIKSQIRFAEEGLASEDPSYGFSLLAEPTVLLYKNVTEQDPTGENNPHLIIALGSKTNEGTQYSDNRFCIIDIDKTEQEIADLQEELESTIRSLTLIALTSDTLSFYADKTEDGTYVSGDVKVAESHIFDDVRKENNLMVTPEGLFIYVSLTYDEANETFTFTVSKADGTLETTTVELPNNYVIRGYYSKKDESIHLIMKSGDEVVIDCENLIAEWDVEGEASKTPVVLTKEEVDYDHTDEHYHVEPWQDILRADVRIKDETFDDRGRPVYDENTTSILRRTTDGRYLYVDGKASNIIYYMDGEKSTVKEALDKLSNIGLSSENDNILIEKTDGFFASTKLEYISKDNTLVFKASGQEEKRIQLNSVELFEHVYYDATREVLVLTYKDNKGETQFVEIPIGEMIRDWEWDVQNEGHDIKLVKTRHIAGNDLLSADAKISNARNNILVDDDHKLYVRGEADNIKFEPTGDTTVKDVLDGLKTADETLNDKIDGEIERATEAEETLGAKIDQEIADRIADVDDEETRAEAAETVLNDKIGTGFTDDPHENVTYKFEQLQSQVNEEAEKLQNEIDRSTEKDNEHDARLDAIDGEIDHLQEEIDAVSADSASSLKDIINNDKSINVDKTDSVRPIISVNLSEEVEHGKENIIKLNADGLYVGVDLEYNDTSNKLIFKTTNTEKEIQLESMSSIISIEYNPTKEAIIITYLTNGHEVKTVEIPVGDLIDEWRVEDGHPNAIQLEKIRIASGTPEQDILKAAVVINNDHDDNILVMDDGALYVSGAQIQQNAEDITTLKDRMDEAEGDINVLETSLANEISRATSEEQRIETKLDAEITRSTEKEATLESALNNEITRATTKDQELTNAINNEVTRATSAETALQTSINNEVTRATSAETMIGHLIEDEAERRTSGDTKLNTKIETETARATEAEGIISTALNNETTRATNAEGMLNAAITNEIERAQNTDNALQQSISDEITNRITSDSALNSKIEQETSRAQLAENTITERLTAEISRSTTEAQTIRDLLATEITNREQGDAELAQEIGDATLTFDDTASIDFNVPSEENNIVRATVKLQEGDNIIKCGEGLYATVHLSYNPGTNRIKLVTSNGEDEEIQLVGASLLENLVYDPVEKELVITYKDAAGEEHIVSFGVEELFNDWIIQNPSEKSALELTKTPPSAHTAGSPDVLYGRVLITDDHDGDGKPDQGSDNVIEIRNNGLYVDGSAMAEALEIAECAKNELRSVEKAVIGHIIAEECGSGYTYEPNTMAYYINSAISFYNADYILDVEIHKTNENVDIVSAKTDCLDDKTDKIYELLYGEGATMLECGEGASYQPYVGACIISAATSFNEADQLLNDQICQMLSMWSSGITCSNESSWVEDGMNRKLQVDTRLSHGKYSMMTSEDLYLEDIEGAYIDPTNTEFTDTNALRIVCLSDASGITPSVETKQNGIYLSNVWDCGLYYDAGTPADQEAKSKAEAAGYNTNYSTDESSTARNYNYMNNVRQHDI